VHNAIRHSASGSVIDISVHTADDSTQTLAVQDHGSGMTASQRDNRGSPSRADPNHTAHSERSGLGLAIVRRVMALHQGALTLADTPGGGLTATLTWPAPQSATCEPAGAPPTPGSDRMAPTAQPTPWQPRHPPHRLIPRSRLAGRPGHLAAVTRQTPAPLAETGRTCRYAGGRKWRRICRVGTQCTQCRAARRFQWLAKPAHAPPGGLRCVGTVCARHRCGRLVQV
jgi:hypothetical protein